MWHEIEMDDQEGLARFCEIQIQMNEWYAQNMNPDYLRNMAERKDSARLFIHDDDITLAIFKNGTGQIKLATTAYAGDYPSLAAQLVHEKMREILAEASASEFYAIWGKENYSIGQVYFEEVATSSDFLHAETSDAKESVFRTLWVLL